MICGSPPHSAPLQFKLSLAHKVKDCHCHRAGRVSDLSILHEKLLVLLLSLICCSAAVQVCCDQCQALSVPALQPTLLTVTELLTTWQVLQRIL